MFDKPDNLFDSLGGTTEDLERFSKDAPDTVLPKEKVNIPDNEYLLKEAASDYVEIEEVGISTEELNEVAKKDLDFLAALAMPTVFKFCFPYIFKAVWEWLLSFANQMRVFPKLALGLPRGFGKTTVIKLFVLYCILFTKKKFILVISANASLAQNIISDIADMLNEPNIKNAFGDWNLGIEKDTQAIKKFGFRGRNITLAALGAEGSLRGLNLKNERPDVMIFEDVQTRECADSEIQSQSLENWMIGTAMKAKSPHGCMFLFIANMYPTKHSILRKLKNNSKWIKFITGGIQADGTSLWEELQPIEQLIEEFESDLESGHPEIFYSEVLNDEEASMNNKIDLSKLPEIPYREGDIPAGNYIIIDPSTDKLGADGVAIGYFEVHDTKPILMEVKEERFSPGETIREALKMALTHNCRLIAVESEAYQYSLLYWFNFICQQLQITGIQCVDIYSGGRAKNTRILEFFKGYAKGELYIHPKARLLVHSQIIEFNALRRDNSDGLLDLMAYAPKVLAEFEEFIQIQNVIDMQEYSAIEVPGFNSAF